MKEKVFIISDIEMGRSDIMDDFTADAYFCNFIKKIQRENEGARLTLILNGDIFDFLKMAYKGSYPRHITEEMSSWKLQEVLRNHELVFAALKDFLKKDCNSVFFVIGNHDADLAWPSLQNTLRAHLEGTAFNLRFDYWYETPALHVEHGHLHDPFFSFKTSRPFVTYKGKKILNTPIGANICFSYLVDL